jgi:hypothetical protein
MTHAADTRLSSRIRVGWRAHRAAMRDRRALEVRRVLDHQLRSHQDVRAGGLR